MVTYLNSNIQNMSWVVDELAKLDVKALTLAGEYLDVCPSLFTLACDDSNKVIGFICTIPVFANIYAIKDLYVAEEYRNKGIATTLIKSINRNNYLMTVAEEVPYICLLEKLGFRLTEMGCYVCCPLLLLQSQL